MIPARTLRERMQEAIEQKAADLGWDASAIIGDLADAAIQALEDPCLVRSADSLMPTFTLLGSDPIASATVNFWTLLSMRRRIHESKLDDARHHITAMEEWHKATIAPMTPPNAIGEG